MIIEFEGVTKRVGSNGRQTTILDRIDLAIRPGSFVAIIGRSGSGKTTLLSLMAGLDRASEGRVRVLDVDLGERTEDEVTRLRGRSIGFVFQDFHLIPTLTALENVQVPLEIHGHLAGAAGKACSLLEAVGLAAQKDRYPPQLSGGENQRVAIARALALDPPLLLADEPTGNLDSASGASVMEILHRIHEEQARTLVLVTHNLELTRGCDEVIELIDGRIKDSRIEDGPIEDGPIEA